MDGFDIHLEMENSARLHTTASNPSSFNIADSSHYGESELQILESP